MFFILQVIWAIGISMILLGIIVLLPFWLVFTLGIIIVFGHNLLDYPEINKNLKGGWLSDLIYFSNFSIYSLGKGHLFLIVYAFLPWLGVNDAWLLLWKILR
jgi:Predicted membrane protein